MYTQICSFSLRRIAVLATSGSEDVELLRYVRIVNGPKFSSYEPSSMYRQSDRSDIEPKAPAVRPVLSTKSLSSPAILA
jgi:hypothetical protein